MAHVRRLAAALLASAAVATLPVAPAQAGPLGGLLGPVAVQPLPVTSSTPMPAAAAELAPLTNLLGSLAGGIPPTAATLAPVTSLLDGVSAQLPLAQRLEIADLLAALQAGGASVAELDELGTLLQRLAAADAVTDALAALLNPIATTLGAPGGFQGLPTSVTGLDGLLGVLDAGGVPTPGDLAGVVALIETVKAQLPEAQQAELDALLVTIGSLPTPEALAPVGELLITIAGAPGVPAPLAAELNQLGPRLSAIPKPATGSRTTAAAPVTQAVVPAFPTAAAQAVAGPKTTIKSVRVDKKRTKLTVVLSCRAGSTSCTSLLYAAKGKAPVTKSQMVVVSAGGSLTKSLKLTSAGRKGLKKKGYRVTVVALGPGVKSVKKASVKRLPAVKKKASVKRLPAVKKKVAVKK